MPGPKHCPHGRDRGTCDVCEERARREREEIMKLIRDGAIKPERQGEGG